jgi:hypothetical protein
MGGRDDFSMGVKETLAKRVGFQCSRPGCGQVTSGPHADPTKSVNIGVAAHITAAALGGPRFDDALSTEERCSQENGIWLCQTCAKLIDSDPLTYTADLLREWRRFAEQRAERELLAGGRSAGPSSVFVRLERLMPALLAEMRADLHKHPFIRECLLLKQVWVFNADPNNPAFSYYFETHPDLTGQFHILENHGLVHHVYGGKVMRYRLSEDLVDYLMS